MGLIDKVVKLKWHGRNKKHFIEKGYQFTKLGDELEVKIEDLHDGSPLIVNTRCDSCNEKSKSEWRYYLRQINITGKYFCKKCASKLYGVENARKTMLKNGTSFEKWCIENNRIDVVERWDSQNKCSPSDINYATTREYYFSCPKGKHKPELKTICRFTSGKQEGSIECKQCNSFAQWGIDNICEDFLDEYWDFEKNNQLNIDPWEISRGSKVRVWIKCQGKDYHGSYLSSCNRFINNVRCPYCSSAKIHPKDSLGQFILNEFGEEFLYKICHSPESLFSYAPYSNLGIYWKCPNGTHKDYKRKISDSNQCDFRCPNCEFSKGETEIEKFLINTKIDYESQMEYGSLIGLGGGLLSYDFYLPELNILLEYDGEYHYKPIKNYSDEPIEFAKERLRKQKIHDKLKDKYAKDNNIKLIRIPYWDFENIEDILQNELNQYNKHELTNTLKDLNIEFG